MISFLSSLMLIITMMPALSFGETLYKCRKDDILIFSDQPCQGQQLETDIINNTSSNKRKNSEERHLYKPDYMNSTERLLTRCSSGDTEACRQIGISKPGQYWTQRQGITRTITNNQQLSGKYARYPKETEIHIECLPSRRQITVYNRNDLNAVFLRDGDNIVNSESGLRGLREYGTSYHSVDEAAATLCR